MLDAIALYTGGKDSHYALIKAINMGYNIKALVVVASEREDSWMFHTINIRWTRFHGEAMGIPMEFISVSGVKEVEVDEMLEGLKPIVREYGVEAIVTGTVASMYQKKRIDKVSAKLGLKHVAPLWGADPEIVLRNESKTLKFIITAIQTYGLGPEWLGESINEGNIERFLSICRKYRINPLGEGGELETFVTDSPLMRKKIKITDFEKVWLPAGSGYLIIKDVELVEK